MERPPGGDPFQRVIERNGLLIPPDAVEGLHCSTPQWYFGRKEIEELSPSRKDGVSFKKETVLRSLYCSFLQDLGMKLKVPQVTIATAMMLCHRFYLRQSHAKNEWQTVASVCMFLACKVEETPRLLKDVVVVAYETIYKRDSSAAQRIKQKDVYDKQKELIVIGERVLLATVGFDLNIQHPYKPLVAALKKLNITHNDITKVAWNFVNDWLRTTLCLEYKPHYVAAGSLYLAAKFHKVKLPSEKGKVWWLEFDVTPTRLEEVIQQMLTLLEQSKNPLMPFSRDKVTQATVANKAPSASTQSCVLNGPNTGSANRVQEKPGGDDKSQKLCVLNGPNTGSANRVQENPGGDDKSQKLSDAHLDNKQCVPNEDVSVARKAEVVGCQNKNPVMPLSGKEVAQAMVAKKAQSGSPHSCVLNGPNSLGDSRKMVDNATGGDGRSLDVTNDCPQNRKDVLNEDSSIIRKEEIPQCQTSDCGSAHSVVEDGNRSDEGEVQEKVVVESNETASCEIASDSGVLNKIEDVNRSKESEVATVVVVSNDTANCIVAADNGLNKIDKDRIREAVKKRKFNRMANKNTVSSTHEDDDSWIVRELENGIEMQYASAEKKQRL